MTTDKDNGQSSCPVDHSTNMTNNECPIDHKSWFSWFKAPQDSNQNSLKSIPRTATSLTIDKLGKDREISSIPRSSDEAYNGGEGEHGGAVSGEARWVYPSEEMFYKAMKRKNWDPKAEDMKVVVPIHNAVNERAWTEILKWETAYGEAYKCGGPKLVSFKGDSSKLTPRARINMLFGYQRPFDRHDWVIDRCGKRVEYVIDFYTGKPSSITPDIPSFYLDVRPKLSLEGAWIRFQKFIGMI
ncbi:cytochrome c/c1 heme-lyase [Dipodascopsis uninucleata]